MKSLEVWLARGELRRGRPPVTVHRGNMIQEVVARTNSTPTQTTPHHRALALLWNFLPRQQQCYITKTRSALIKYLWKEKLGLLNFT